MDFSPIVDNLKKREYTVSTFENNIDACEYLTKEINGFSVGFGGSMTLKELGLFDSLSSNNEVWWHGKGDQLKEYGSDFVIKKAMTTDIYITSANALTESGQIVNIDGRCNRISSTLYGHKKIYYIIGKNKIAPTLEKAIWRARNIAAPKNAQRLGINTPCAVKGDKCYDCSSPQRICRGFLVLERPPSGIEVEIVLINDSLGY
ncbi:MAG: lactate utilization protein [Clostridia bacterium]|nr:lactate utilization protein [Clostridia bacterium]